MDHVRTSMDTLSGAILFRIPQVLPEEGSLTVSGRFYERGLHWK